MSDVLIRFERRCQESGGKPAITMVLRRYAESSIRLDFPGFSDAVELTAYAHGSSISVTREDDCWDLALDLGFVPKPVASRFFCRLCLIRPREVFTTRAAFFLDQINLPPVEWVATTRVLADALPT